MITHLINILRSKLLSLQDPNKGNFEISPYRDWLILIAIIAATGITFGALSVYAFLIINNDEGADVGVVGVGLPESVHTEQLRKTLLLFSEKEKTLEAILQKPPQIIDPSL